MCGNSVVICALRRHASIHSFRVAMRRNSFFANDGGLVPFGWQQGASGLLKGFCLARVRRGTNKKYNLIMNKQTLRAGIRFLAPAIGLALLPQAQAVDITLDFSALPGAAVRVVGTTLDFVNNASGRSLGVTDSSGAGDAIGKQGKMTGTWTIGAISSLPGGVQTAPVFGTGTLLMYDGLGGTLTGALAWNDLVSVGTIEGLNLAGALNLTALQYTHGASYLQDFVDLVASGKASQVLSFQFTSPVNLTKLTDGTPRRRSFSGTIFAESVPDAGATSLLLSASLVGLVLARFRWTTPLAHAGVDTN